MSEDQGTSQGFLELRLRQRKMTLSIHLDSISGLQAQLEIYRQKEKAWQEERTILLSYQKKLALAGNHLKKIALENSTLSKQVNELQEQKQQQQQVYDDTNSKAQIALDSERKKHDEATKELEKLGEKLKEKDEQLENSQKSTIVLTRAIQTMSTGHESEIPDISSPAILGAYVETAKNQLNSKLEAANIEKVRKNKSNRSNDASGVANACDATIVNTGLEEIMADAEQANLDSSIPPDLLQTLEKLRSHLLSQTDTITKEKENNQKAIETNQRDFKRQTTQLQMAINTLSEEKDALANEKDRLENALESKSGFEEKAKELELQLEETEKKRKEKEESLATLSQEHQSLLAKLSHIKENLMPRLEADKQLRYKVEELTAELQATHHDLEKARADMVMRDNEMAERMAQKEHKIGQLQIWIEEVQSKREEFEAMAMQVDAERSQLEDRLQYTELELARLKKQLMEENEENESERASLANLQTVLEEFQATKDAEIRAAVEHIERQLESAKISLAEYQSRAQVAEASLEQYQHDVAKAQRYEQEIKEKGLLIGKLRHEAIILNEHLVEAMRRLKEESSENNVDRQLVTSLLVGFLIAPRGDRKRYDILTILASVLQLSTEQKEQIGLIRSTGLPRSSSSSSVTSWQNPRHSIHEDEPKESFTDAWISFLLKESNTHARSRQESPEITQDI
ncbi:hypothetical protein F4703DRAFT_1788573 [Phycomyces blakesleeanus]